LYKSIALKTIKARKTVVFREKDKRISVDKNKIQKRSSVAMQKRSSITPALGAISRMNTDFESRK